MTNKKSQEPSKAKLLKHRKWVEKRRETPSNEELKSKLLSNDVRVYKTDNEANVEETALRNSLRNITVMLARENFYAFVQLMGPFIVPGFIDSPHIKVICNALQRVYETPNARLMIFLPPGASKSILGSLLFPAWVYGRSPDWQILHVGHGSDFIAVFGGKIRDLLKTAEYQEIFPNVTLSDSFTSRDYWETTAKGVYRCAGVGGGIAGKRGHIGICGLDTNYVITEGKGPQQLKNIKEGTKILGPNGYEVVTKRLDRRHKVCYTINNEVEVSPEHPFLNYETKEWVEAKDLLPCVTKLTVGDSLWTRIVKKCTKYGAVLKGVVGF